jgi:hypothetical protein
MRRAAKNTLFLFTGLVNEAYQRKDGCGKRNVVLGNNGRVGPVYL